MSIRDASATFAGIKIGGTPFIQQPNEFPSGPARAATCYHQRLAGGANHARGPFDRDRVGEDNRICLGLEMRVEQQAMKPVGKNHEHAGHGNAQAVGVVQRERVVHVLLSLVQTDYAGTHRVLHAPGMKIFIGEDAALGSPGRARGVE
jgi:hypothetical protein